MATTIVDPDDPSDWPSAVTAAVASVVTDDDDSFPWGEPGDRDLREALGKTRLLVYHATRLLPHEAEEMQRGGLRVLSEELIANRLRSAVESGDLAEEAALALLSGNALRSRRAERRANQICFFAGTAVMTQHVHALRPLLTMWGGEGINFTSAAKPLAGQLRSLGRPTIVVVALPHTPTAELVAYPSLTGVFVAAYEGSSRSADVFWRGGDISGSGVVAMWTPGSPQYDRFTALPRA